MIYALAVPGPIEDVEELRVLQWHGEPGTRFAAGEMIVELETHKAVVEVRARRAGRAPRDPVPRRRLAGGRAARSR
jgi:pyruvate/2-oxoglutarate dehydrogenase complex dihydrolipoamide acyltransferase (E2) component